MMTTWLHTFTIKVDGLKLSQDYYTTTLGGILIICSKSYNGLTEIIESWSFLNE